LKSVQKLNEFKFWQLFDNLDYAKCKQISQNINKSKTKKRAYIQGFPRIYTLFHLVGVTRFELVKNPFMMPYIVFLTTLLQLL
jgi:hypothetical protein